MDTFTLYLLLMIPSVGSVVQGFAIAALVALGVLTVIAAGAMLFNYTSDYGATEEKAAKWRGHAITFSKYMGWPVGAIILTSFIPSLQIILALVAWELGSNVEGLTNLPENMVEYLNTLIDVELQELKDTAQAVTETNN